MAWTKTRWIYDPKRKLPFQLSRSKIDFFLQCPRCFYLAVRLGIKRPSMPGFALNLAVDELLKKEFDLLRKKGQAHELMKKYKIDAVPFSHPDIDTWRNNFVGKRYLHEGTNLLIFGAIDDLWINKKDELIVVDYKATSTIKEISLDDKWKQNYKKQLEIYQWIYEKSGFKVSKTGYIVYANASKNRAKFDGKLEFELTIHPHKGNTSWIEPTIFEIKKTLDSDKLPASGAECEYCPYRKDASTKE
jgi:CRISPR/Cas system-associated exonuclease Cas4 (RecB family)